MSLSRFVPTFEPDEPRPQDVVLWWTSKSPDPTIVYRGEDVTQRCLAVRLMPAGELELTLLVRDKDGRIVTEMGALVTATLQAAYRVERSVSAGVVAAPQPVQTTRRVRVMRE